MNSESMNFNQDDFEDLSIFFWYRVTKTNIYVT